MEKPTYDELLAFVQQTARLYLDGEVFGDDGNVFDMGIDDAFDTVNSVIGGARDLVGDPGYESE